MKLVADSERGITPEGLAPGLGLGLDAGGSATRWTLCTAGGAVLALGELPGLSGLMLSSEEGRERLAQAWADLARDVQHFTANASVQVLAGFTGLGEDPATAQSLRSQIASALGVDEARVAVVSDVVLAYEALLPREQGILLYAGTGSIAVQLDAKGQLHRAGGRGYILDDAGAGYWLAREALRRIWRQEDAEPGAWQHSRMARCVFEQLGGSDWSLTRRCLYQGTRGDVGVLALAVARAAQPEGAEPADEAALALLREAAKELAEVAACLLRRLGPQPVVLAGRVFELHPLIEQGVRQHLPAGVAVLRSQAAVHQLAARKAASGAQLQSG